MASTHLVGRIRSAGTPCVEKPEANTWYPAGWPAAARVERDKPVVAGLDERPTPLLCERFLAAQDRLSSAPERFSLDPARSLGDNLVDYFAFLRTNRTACVLRGTSLEGLIAKAGLRDVVFLVRDPIQSFVSYAKPKRHGRTFRRLGGIESEDAIAFWCWSWNCLADEYLLAKASGADPVLICYERVEEHVARVGSPFLDEIFSTFRPRENDVRLPASCVQRVRELVGDRYERIYGTDLRT
jgi:hypothetical protein